MLAAMNWDAWPWLLAVPGVIVAGALLMSAGDKKADRRLINEQRRKAQKLDRPGF